ncbi:carbohydrate ABC transporter permease [Cohnella silvisoli]|uniref:Sugar ABC transporter permease n=1 Tax=Cohnella silvisoli TaxID=2873699 RepID=A0ABV1KU38_9BACL|nr:sugar ABC transporter permease [Cohnella silvisoli]MCD9023199.1 sugar ABC transporter permease [Cohnella silvisoli]
MDRSTAAPIRSLDEFAKRPPMKWSKHILGYLFLLPAVVIFFTFLWLPIGKGIVYSFYDIDFVKGDSFVGWANYTKIFKDAEVTVSAKNTLYYMMLGILIGFWVPILFAIAISEIRRFQGFVRVAAYLPFVVPLVVLYGLWKWLYDPVGPINAALEKLGFSQVLFLTDKAWSMISIVFMETWQSFGSAMLIYLAAIMSVPRDWYEAAEIDGAGVWKRIRHITLPAIKNQIILLFLLQLIATSQGFQTQFAMLDGGPNNSTLTYALLIQRYAFTRQDYGAASALGVLMFLVLGLLAVLQYRMSNKKEE